MTRLQTIGLVVMMALATLAAAQPQPAWQQKIVGYADKPAVAVLQPGGKPAVVVNTDAGVVQALAAADGASLWRIELENERFRFCPVVADVDGDGKAEIIATGVQRGDVLCLKGEDGKALWQKDGEHEGIGGQACVATLGEGAKPVLLYVAGNKVHCLNAADGQEKWAIRLPAKSESAVTAATIGGKSLILVGTNNGLLLALDADGKTLWQVRVGGRVVKPALVADVTNTGRPYIFAVGSSAMCSLTADGKVRWQWSTGSPQGLSSSMAIADLTGKGTKSILVASGNGNLYALSGDGNVIWASAVVPEGSKALPGSTPCVLTLAGGGSLVVMSSPRPDAPGLLAFDGRSGNRVWTAKTTSFAHCCPAAADLDGDGQVELIYSVPGKADNTATLGTLKLTAKASGGWLKFNGDLACTGTWDAARRDALALLGLAPAGK